MSEKHSLCSPLSLSLCLFFSLFPSSHSLVRRSGQENICICLNGLVKQKFITALVCKYANNVSFVFLFSVCTCIFSFVFYLLFSHFRHRFFPFGMCELPIDETWVIVPKTTADKHNRINAKALCLCCHSSERAIVY